MCQSLVGGIGYLDVLNASDGVECPAEAMVVDLDAGIFVVAAGAAALIAAIGGTLIVVGGTHLLGHAQVGHGPDKEEYEKFEGAQISLELRVKS